MASKLPTFMFMFLLLIITADVSSVNISALPSTSSSHHHFRSVVASSISASPSYFFPASSPLSTPPAMSPDITPLLPSPGPDSALPPSGSIFPTIPSSPSPPNPESILAPQPLMAATPAGQMLDSSSVALQGSGSVLLGLLALWLV